MDFQVTNSRSIRGNVKIDFVATSRLKSNIDDPGYFDEKWNLRILPAIAVFGQNGAGKTNILTALFDLFFILIVGRLDKSDGGYPMNEVVKPFLFDSGTANHATSYSVSFLIHGSAYDYSLEILRDVVIAESLYIRDSPNSRPELFYHRKTVDGKVVWSFGPRISDSHKELGNTIQSTAIYFSLLSTLRIHPISQIRDFMLGISFPFTPRSKVAMVSELVKSLKEDPTFTDKLREFLCLLDINITKIKFDGSQILCFHPTASGENASLPLSSESDGTQHLLFLGALILRSLQNGGVLIIDELDSHLHPLISHEIVSLFQDPKVNKKNTQLVFTSHDTTLIDQELLDRDQIYIANRDSDGSTRIVTVAENRKRNDLVLQKAYLEGRLTGLPVLRYTEDIHEAVAELLMANSA